MKKLMMTAAAVMCMSAPAFAMSNSDMSMMGNYMMMKADTNHDGMISKDEMSAMNDKKMDMMDTNHDGMVSKEEMMAGMKMEHQDMMGMMKNGMSKSDMSKSDMSMGKGDAMHDQDTMMNK